MKNSALDYMHRLLAESLYRGYSGRRPSHQEATLLAAYSVRWFRELLLRLSIQHCLDEVDPMADQSDGTVTSEGLEGEPAPIDGSDLFGGDRRAPAHAMGPAHSRDEALWDALCEGRLVLRIEGSEVNASVMPRTPINFVH